MNLKTIAAAAILSMASFAASAQTAKPVSTLPADNARIRNGVKSGELTPVERARLKSQERNVRRERRYYKADGTVTSGERADLRKDKKKLSKNIYRQKHDGQVKTP